MHNLDIVDKRILFELDRDARVADTTLAKLTKKSKEAVRYRIRKMEKAGIITGYSTWIDPTNLGYESAKIYLTLANRPLRKKESRECLLRDKRLFWLGFAEGAWNVGLTFFVKSQKEFYELKNNLFASFNDLILENHTASLIEVNVCDKTFLYNASTQWKSVFAFNGAYKPDEIEKQILKELFKNSSMNIVDIAIKHNSTVDIIRHRMKKLIQLHVISRFMTVIDYTKLGYALYKTFLYFKRFSKEDEQKLMNYCVGEPNIIHLIKQISPWDVELEIMCESYQKYSETISRLTERFSDIIAKVETAIISEDYVFPAKQMVFE